MVVAASTQESLYHWVFGPLRFAGEGRTRVAIAKKSQAARNVRQWASRRVRREDIHSMSSAFFVRSTSCQIDSSTFLKKTTKKKSASKAHKMQAGRLRSQWLTLFFVSSSSLLTSSSSSSSGCFPTELPRRPGAPSRRRRPSPANYGRRRRGGAPEPLVSSRAEAEAVFLSSLFRRPRPDEESDRADEASSAVFNPRLFSCRCSIRGY